MSASAILTICNQKGLHARAAAKFVRLAEEYPAHITVRKGEITVGATSIMGLMMLAASRGTELRLEAEGDRAQDAIEALQALVRRKFDEPD